MNDKIENKIKMWLRQQTKDVSAAGFGELIKTCDKCTKLGVNYVVK